MHVCTHLRVRSHTHTFKRDYNESNEQLCTIPPGTHLSSFSNKSPVFEFRAIGKVLGSDFGLASSSHIGLSCSSRAIFIRDTALIKREKQKTDRVGVREKEGGRVGGGE